MDLDSLSKQISDLHTTAIESKKDQEYMKERLDKTCDFIDGKDDKPGAKTRLIIIENKEKKRAWWSAAIGIGFIGLVAKWIQEVLFK